MVCLQVITNFFLLYYGILADEPLKPGTPEITDYDNRGVNLKWEKPASDGGAPIEKYIIEKKDRFKPDWEKATEVSGDQLEARVNDLKENGEYQFRIVAVNKAGPSPPSDASKTQIIKHRACMLDMRFLILLMRFELLLLGLISISRCLGKMFFSFFIISVFNVPFDLVFLTTYFLHLTRILNSKACIF